MVSAAGIAENMAFIKIDIKMFRQLRPSMNQTPEFGNRFNFADHDK